MSGGSSRRTASMRARTSCAARSPLRPRSNSTTTDETPSSVVEVMRSTPSTVLKASSSRRLTSRSMVSGEAPG